MLHAACGSGRIEIADYLLKQKKVNINVIGKDGWKAFDIAVMTGLLEIVQLLLRDSEL